MRKSGILAAISSLPSCYGIGTLGKSAFDFVDFLSLSDQYYWQILPINPPGKANSPYQSRSAFAGNPLFIDPGLLLEEKLLTKEEHDGCIVPFSGRTDYSMLFSKRLPILETAAKRVDSASYDYLKFQNENSYWLDDYCDYMLQSDGVMPEVSRGLQFLFFNQWKCMKQYANSKGVHIIGDIPIYISRHSADFEFHRELFESDVNGEPSLVAGCPPDDYSESGQLWGNPIYDWSKMEESDFAWWRKRMLLACRLYDAVRIDHFRGFYEYYAVDSKSESAKDGCWIKGPGMKFVNMLRESFPQLHIIAEDLGLMTDEVRSFFEMSGFPGMKILQFGFNDSGEEHLIHNFKKNSVVYTGTHDNATMIGWLCSAKPVCVERAMDYFGSSSVTTLADDFIRAAYSSISDTAIIPIQDWLKKGSDARMNTPSTVKNNWEYRFSADELTERLCTKIRKFTKMYNR